jgi:hypothetical membrane protein
MTRRADFGLLCGPLAAVILALGIAGLPAMLPGYSPIHQTVSEIGEVGSPARVPFTIVLLCVALCLLVFAAALRKRALQKGQATFPAYLIAAQAISCAGVGFFSYPHPLHNVFGMAELIGYQAPLVLAITWRHDRGSSEVVRMSWVMAAVVWIVVIINLPILDRQGSAYALIRPTYGLVQRALFASWFTWCALLGILLFRDRDTYGVLR